MSKKTTLLDSDPMLGAAVMLVRGASRRLEWALEDGDVTRILAERIYADRTKEAYFRAKRTAPRSSFVTKSYIDLGDASIEELSLMTQTASRLLSRALRLIPTKEKP